MNNLLQEFQPQNPSNDSEEFFDFKLYFFKIIKNWWLILLSVIICYTVAYIYLRYSTPIYKINATLMVVDNKKGTPKRPFSISFNCESNLDWRLWRIGIIFMYFDQPSANVARSISIKIIDNDANAAPDRQYDHCFKGKIEEQEYTARNR